MIEEVCGTRRIRDGMRIKGKEWRGEEIRRIVERQKRMVREVRRRGKEEWTLCIADNFKENKKKLEGSKRG